MRLMHICMQARAAAGSAGGDAGAGDPDSLLRWVDLPGGDGVSLRVPFVRVDGDHATPHFCAGVLLVGPGSDFLFVKGHMQVRDEALRGGVGVARVGEVYDAALYGGPLMVWGCGFARFVLWRCIVLCGCAVGRGPSPRAALRVS